MRTYSLLVGLAVCLSGALLFVSPLQAQSIWVKYDNRSTFAVEVLKGNYATDMTFATSAVFATLALPFSERVTFWGELPLAHAGLEETDQSETALGNPYLGLQVRFPNESWFVDVGLRFPAAPDVDQASFLAASTGIFTDPVDRQEAFLPDVLPVTAALNFTPRNASGLTLRLRSGSFIWIPTSGQDEDDTEWGVLVSGQLWYEGSQVRVGGGLSSRIMVSQKGNFGERSVHQFGLNADLLLHRFRPGVYFRLPLDDDWNDQVDFVFGLKFDVPLR